MTASSKITEHMRSFIPKGIEKLKSAVITIGVTQQRKENLTPITTLNSVNQHLFKPKFYQKKETLFAYTCSPDIASQTLEAINGYLSSLGKSPIKYQVNETNLMNDYRGLIRSTEVCSEVLIGQYFSIMDMLVAEVIAKEFSKKAGETYFLETNCSRIDKANKRQKVLPETEKVLSRVLSVEEIEILRNKLKVSSEIHQEHYHAGCVQFYEKKFTIIQSPWGGTLAREMGKELSKNRKVKRVFFVGGCAGLQNDMRIEDVAIPLSYMSEDIKRTPLLEKVSFNTSSLSLSRKKRKDRSVLHFADFYTVKNSLGTKGIRQSLTASGIGCIEMELAEIANALRNKEFFPIFYIMDLPNKGIGLSETYYNFDFLQRLAEKKVRAKNICYAIVLENIMRVDRERKALGAH